MKRIKYKSGVYCILNIMNGNCYIGSSIDLKNRCKQHFFNLRKGHHDNKHLQNAWNKYGESSFLVEILVRCEISNLLLKEQEYIDAHDWKTLYNIAPIAGNNLGCLASDETKRKLSESHKGYVTPESQKRKQSESMKLYFEDHDHWNIGYNHSDETKRKIADFQKGQVRSEETRRRMTEAKKGTVHSEETKRKISATKKEQHRKRKLVELNINQ